MRIYILEINLHMRIADSENCAFDNNLMIELDEDYMF